MKREIEAYLSEHYQQLQLGVKVDERSIVYLSGECDSWKQLDEICHKIAKFNGIRSLVSELTVKNNTFLPKQYTSLVKQGTDLGVIDTVDVVIVGGGVTGCAVARELSRYDCRTVLLEKEEDVASGASKANNGDIHSGYLETPGTLKAQLNVKGNAMYDGWAQELNFEFKRPGNLVVIYDDIFMEDLKYGLDRATQNHVPAEIISGERLLELEPLLNTPPHLPTAALFVPSMGTVDPWEVTIALAENAIENGCKIILDCTVCDVLHENNQLTAVVTNQGIIRTRYLINCAGVYADDISAMAGDKCFTIHPRKGTIAIIDKNIPAYNRPLRVVDANRRLKSSGNTKGGGMATTISGNNLLGPSATEVQDKEDMETTRDGLEMALARSSSREITPSTVIRFFSGTRPATYNEDFYIVASEKVDGLINVAGIQSPGLASAPAVAELAISLLLERMKLAGETPHKKDVFNPYRKRAIKFSTLSRTEQDALIKKMPAYGNVICRCETITEGEILEALKSPLVPTSIDAIKRRTRAGMGRCQGGFCQPRVLEIIARELGKEWIEINLKGKNSHVLVAKNRMGDEES